MRTSPDIFGLEFKNDNISRAILYRVKYGNGPLNGQAEVGVILLYNKKDYDNIIEILNLCRKEDAPLSNYLININFINDEIKSIMNVE